MFGVALYRFNKLEMSRDLLVKTLYLNIVGVKDVFAPKPEPIAEITNIPQPEGKAVLPTAIPQLEGVTTEYKSDKLGISFLYASTLPTRQYLTVRESANTIYIYVLTGSKEFTKISDDKYLKEKGHSKSIDVFLKQPEHTLEETVKEQFLKGYSEDNCTIKHTRDGRASSDTQYQTLRIIVNTNAHPNTSLHELLDQCPPSYTSSNGQRYFMLDSSHPERFLFINNGHDTFTVNDGQVWDRTIEFFK